MSSGCLMAGWWRSILPTVTPHGWRGWCWPALWRIPMLPMRRWPPVGRRLKRQEARICALPKACRGYLAVLFWRHNSLCWLLCVHCRPASVVLAVERLTAGVLSHDARPWLARFLTQPTLVLVGNEDRLTPRYQADCLVDMLPDAQAGGTAPCGTRQPSGGFACFCGRDGGVF